MKRLASFRRQSIVTTLTTAMLLGGCASGPLTPALQAQENSEADQKGGTPEAALPPTSTLLRHYQGTTVCTAPDGSHCGTDYWSMYRHKDGSRVIHVASETARAGEVRHASIVIEAGGVVGEAFMHNRSPSEALGSTYVFQTDEGVEQAINNNVGLGKTGGVELSKVESDRPRISRSISVGPAASDGIHFFNVRPKAGEGQEHQVFWMGGSFGGSMAGVFRSTTYTSMGEEAITMPQGYDIPTDHYKMASGSEVWLTKDSRIVVRADVRFGPGPAMRYELKDLKVTALNTKQPAP
ncbi:MAG: hypothetical protein ABJP70_00425 [Erythrobacter sp.]